MIKIRIKNADHEIDVQFPISENELYAKLAEIHAIEGKDAPQSAFVTDVYWPEEFSMLKDRFANLDELNYLARSRKCFVTIFTNEQFSLSQTSSSLKYIDCFSTILYARDGSKYSNNTRCAALSKFSSSAARYN